MPEAENRKLTVEQAARLIYHTNSPTPQQVGAVADLIARGSLAGTRKGQWSTSTVAVAKYMAAASMNKKPAGGSSGKKPAPNAEQLAHSGAGQLQPVYRDLLKDYFLAVITRRRSRSSEAFQRAVLVGQIGLVVGIVSLFIWLAWTAGGPPPPPEMVAVEAWLAKNMDYYQIEEYFPPEPSEGGGRKIRVKYEYSFGAKKRVYTDREFIIEDGKVARFSTTD